MSILANFEFVTLDITRKN